ncbi:MAG: hypothetical protein J6K58_04740 [Lachnospiraceae bacterium]|nr:hypothetical protein [Lachnospiraceae bacterium]
MKEILYIVFMFSLSFFIWDFIFNFLFDHSKQIREFKEHLSTGDEIPFFDESVKSDEDKDQ